MEPALLHRDSATFLKEKLLESMRANGAFSMRAFAARIEMSPGNLSKVFNRKKRLSIESAHRIARLLKLPARERETFLLLVQIDTAATAELRNDFYRKLRRRTPRTSTNLPLEQFSLISEWYGLAVLEMLTVFAGSWPHERIAEYLGITRTEVDLTIERLIRIGAIEVDSGNGYRRSMSRLLATTDVPNEAIRNYGRAILKRAEASIAEQTPGEKTTGTEVFAFDPAQIEDARSRTNAYLDDMQRLAMRGENRTEMYQVYANFFRLESENGDGETVAQENENRKRRNPVMKYRSIVLVLSLFNGITTAAYAGEGSGTRGGGNVIVCYSRDGIAEKIVAAHSTLPSEALDSRFLESIQVLDDYDASLVRGGMSGGTAPDLILPLRTEKPADYVLRIAARLHGVSRFGDELAELTNRVNSYGVVYHRRKDASSPDDPNDKVEGLAQVQDYGVLNYRIKRSRCLIATAAIQNRDRDRPQIDIDGRIYFHPKFGTRGQGMLMLHEMAFFIASQKALGNSADAASLQSDGVRSWLTLAVRRTPAVHFIEMRRSILKNIAEDYERAEPVSLRGSDFGEVIKQSVYVGAAQSMTLAEIPTRFAEASRIVAEPRLAERSEAYYECTSKSRGHMYTTVDWDRLFKKCRRASGNLSDSELDRYGRAKLLAIELDGFTSKWLERRAALELAWDRMIEGALNHPLLPTSVVSDAKAEIHRWVRQFEPSTKIDHFMTDVIDRNSFDPELKVD